MDSDITLIGAGLAGSLLAVYLARRGFTVDAYERRPDMRKGQVGGGRSINLALSTRGIHALRDVGLDAQIMKIAIPMKGRMIHSPTGELKFQRYGKDDSEVIYAISRNELNMAVLNAAESYAAVRLSFHQRCLGADLATGDMTLVDERSGQRSVRRCRRLIGTDGSASAVRLDMQTHSRFNLTQEYLDYGYKELLLPAGPNAQFQLEKNALHIWPRGNYMLIALPNLGGSFTCTFFFPFAGPVSFESLNSEERVLSFFREQFPDAVALMPSLLEDYFGHPTGSMVTIKCSPWHVEGRVALLGDAAHAIVPFFGQGMNCAFEDCTYLDECIGRGLQSTGKSHLDWSELFAEYERLRKINTDAIADLAVENFVEMRDLVAQPKFHVKKAVEQALQQRYPEQFIPKYSMVTFHRIPYSVALSRGIIQDRLLDKLCEGIDRPDQVDWQKAERLLETALNEFQQAPSLSGS